MFRRLDSEVFFQMLFTILESNAQIRFDICRLGGAIFEGDLHRELQRGNGAPDGGSLTQGRNDRGRTIDLRRGGIFEQGKGLPLRGRGRKLERPGRSQYRSGG